MDYTEEYYKQKDRAEQLETELDDAFRKIDILENKNKFLSTQCDNYAKQATLAWDIKSKTDKEVVKLKSLLMEANIKLSTLENDLYNKADDHPTPDNWERHKKVSELRKQISSQVRE